MDVSVYVKLFYAFVKEHVVIGVVGLVAKASILSLCISDVIQFLLSSAGANLLGEFN